MGSSYILFNVENPSIAETFLYQLSTVKNDTCFNFKIANTVVASGKLALS